MNVSVVVVSFNTCHLLRRCLQSVYATAGGNLSEVLVVDNASDDGSPDMVEREFPTVRLIRSAKNLGFAAANNVAIQASRGDAVLLLNSDTELLPAALRRLVDAMERHPIVGVVGGRLLNPDRSFQSSFADFPTLLSEILLLTKLSRLIRPATFPSYPEHDSREERVVDWVVGACMLVRKAAIDTVGLLDEGYYMYTEETDWCYRMRAAGWLTLYVPEARVLHWSGQSANVVPEAKRLQLYRSKTRFLAKHRGRGQAATFRVLVRMASAGKALLWAASSLDPRPAVRQKAQGNLKSHLFLLGNY